jgi:hypothetical protein
MSLLTPAAARAMAEIEIQETPPEALPAGRVPCM